MTERKPLPEAIRKKVIWPLRLTQAGMVAERITHAFWPVWTLCFAGIAAIAFGFQDWAPLELFWLSCLAAPIALVWALVRGVRRFRWPQLPEAIARLDQTLPGRPLSTLSDEQALGRADAGSQAVWRAHLGRMAERVGRARGVAPDLMLATRDPFALRYAALTAFLMAVLFGSLWKLAEIGSPPHAAQAALAPAASWEGWAEPPKHTGRPSLYLNSVAAGDIELPAGSRIILRFYGAPDAFTLRETVSKGDVALAPTSAVPTAVPPAAPEGSGAPTAGSQHAQEFTASRSGTVAIDGTGGREWNVTVVPDLAPSVSLAGPMKKRADGTMSQPFSAKDDFAVVKGEVQFALDLGALDRRYGLAVDPDAQQPLIFDLPLPVTGSRAEFTGAFTEDASEHVWANLPVTMTLSVTDGLGQTGSSAPQSLILPGRRFFDPLAGAVVEMRRDLLWSGQNGRRVSQLLKAVTNRPEGFVRNERAYLMLRVAIRQLDAGLAVGPLSTALRTETAKALWEVALLIEDGGLDDALDRMRQAQERLSEAIRNGASPEEIQKLMDDLRAATDNYLTMLAERNSQDPADKFAKQQPRQTLTQDQLQQMMDEIQKLMEEGRMAEAQALLEQLNKLMENLKVTQGEGGDGKGGKGGKAMKDLRQTLRDQQNLSDDAFRKGQQNPGQQGSSKPGDQSTGQGGQAENQDQAGAGDNGTGDGKNSGSGQGDGNGTDPDQSGQDQSGQGLAERQRALRQELDRQKRALPDAQGQDARNARRALDDAGRAMQEAEDALRDGDIPRAIDRQAEAIQQLHQGMRSLNEALTKDENRLPGADGQAQNGPERDVPRDPLGRADGAKEGVGGQLGAGPNGLNGEDVYRRARDLLDEIRRKSSDPSRPSAELEYLKRLLDQY
jgi:uncharacterized protein (TIGR02302 family)